MPLYPPTRLEAVSTWLTVATNCRLGVKEVIQAQPVHPVGKSQVP
jgi:hypothetical protein